MNEILASPSGQIREVLACASLSDEDLSKVLGVDLDTLVSWKRRRTPLEESEGKRLTVLLDFVRLAKLYLSANQLERWLTVTNHDMRNRIPLDRLMIEPAKVQKVFLSEVSPLIAATAG